MARAFRILVATGLVSLASFAFGAAGAQAHTMVCDFRGLVGTADPDGAGFGVQSLQTDINDGGPITFATDFDTGDYEFHGPATCLVLGAVNPANNGVHAATIHSVGDYRNRICGTGSAESTPGEMGDADADATTVDYGIPPDGVVTPVDYQIEFVAGNGTLTVDGATAGGHVIAGYGFVHITPSEGNCATVDVTAFDVEGSFVLTGP